MAASSNLSPQPNGSVLALELNEVSRRFGALIALEGVSLAVPVGQRRAILGSNGAGKTTLFNTISGDFPLTAGRIKLYGEDITALAPHRRTRLGLRRTYQISQLFGGLSVLDSVLLACYGVSGRRCSLRRPSKMSAIFQEAMSILFSVRLEDCRYEMVSTLSHGQQRQLEIGMVLAGFPRLILFDEPAAGLSPAERRDLVAILTALPREIAIVIIEHDLDIALQVSDYVSVMHNGKIFKEGTPREIEIDPRVQEIYLGGRHA